MVFQVRGSSGSYDRILRKKRRSVVLKLSIVFAREFHTREDLLIFFFER